jgi:DNA invertase Pin-like site-specific DNA recombinase
VRVSTPEQNYELQRAEIERAAAARGDGPLTWYSETRSGRSWVRPELERLTRAAARGLHGRVYVWRLDRLTRRGPADTLATVQALRSAGCQLVSVTEGFDFAGAAGELLVAMLGFLAAGESEAQLDRQRAARTALEARGGKWGRPAKISPEQCARIAALASEGRSVRSIAMAVKLKRSTVHDALARAARVLAIAGPES